MREWLAGEVAARLLALGLEDAAVRAGGVAGAVGRVDVELLPDGSAAVTWIEFAEQRSSFRIRRAERNGSRSASLAVLSRPPATPSRLRG